MTQQDSCDWFQYHHEGMQVLVSPPVAHRHSPDWTECCAGGLVRSALGLLPHQARYVLSRDNSVRIELAGSSVAASDLERAHALFNAERQAWEGKKLSAEQATDRIQQLDIALLSNAQAMDRRRAAIESFRQALANHRDLAQAFIADTAAPWGLFRLANEEIITVEADPDSGIVRLDRVLGVPTDSPENFVASIEWLLRINSISVIGPRCEIQLEHDDNLALLSYALKINEVSVTAVQQALDELEAKGRSIEDTWEHITLAQASNTPQTAAPAPSWLRG
jgi:hypothetical protein